jgi:protein tyrosine/serine phosphatase
MLDWHGCDNVRDVGGLPTADGRRIRPGALIRSGHHAHLSAAAVRAVRSGRISLILDLRRAAELRTHPSPFARDPIYRHVPLLPDVLGYEVDPDTYGPMLDHNAERIRAAFVALADAPPGGVVVHCQAGRDRTGGLVALALAAAGVPAADIAGDYARTAGTDPAAMLNTLRHVDAVYGGADGYLRTIGVPPGHVRRVRDRLRDG